MNFYMWILPGAFWHKNLYLNYANKLNHSIFYDGVNNCAWNGGRNNIIGNDWDDDVCKLYYENGHNIALTFSNNCIDINDKTGNFLLEKLSENTYNYVIASSDNLAQYIKKKYDNIYLIFSITSTPQNYDASFYKSKLKLFDYIVPRWHHIKNISADFKTSLDRFEIMINHTCISNCPYWDKHYNLISEHNRNNLLYDSYDNKDITCMINEKLTDSKIASVDIMKRYIKAKEYGFNRFKLAGREMPLEKLESQINILSKVIFKNI